MWVAGARASATLSDEVGACNTLIQRSRIYVLPTPLRATEERPRSNEVDRRSVFRNGKSVSDAGLPCWGETRKSGANHLVNGDGGPIERRGKTSTKLMFWLSEQQKKNFLALKNPVGKADASEGARRGARHDRTSG